MKGKMKSDVKSPVCFRRSVPMLILAITLYAPGLCVAFDFALSATTTTGADKKDMGLFNAGETLSISFSGQISLIDGWDTLADGSLVNPVTIPGFEYANAGASGYPTDFGGDGINHFPNGGANFDAGLGGISGFGAAGEPSTDTSNTNTIRLGSVVGTFSANPSRSDWFAVGVSNAIVVPADGVHFYLAVHDTTYGNNSGNFAGKLTYLNPPLLRIRTYAGLEIEGEVGQNYRVEYTTAVPPANWLVLTNIVLPSSPHLLLDTTGPAVGTRFYRAIMNP